MPSPILALRQLKEGKTVGFKSRQAFPGALPKAEREYKGESPQYLTSFIFLHSVGNQLLKETRPLSPSNKITCLP